MQFEVTFRNTEATDALRERAEKKFAKVAKHLREPIDAHLVLRVEKHRHIAELAVRAAGEQYFKAKDTTDDMYASIDGLMNKLERTVRRQRERLLDRKHGHEDYERFLVPMTAGEAAASFDD